MIAYLLHDRATGLYHITSLKILEATSSPCGISPCNIIQSSRLSVYFLVGIGIREIKVDKALSTLLKIENIPTANAFSKYLRKHGTDGEDGMRKINKRYLKRFLKSIENEELILDIDATFIEAHKNTAKWSYKDAPGYI